MALCQSECDRISDLFETNCDEGFSELINIIKIFTENYGALKSIQSVSCNDFLHDTKLVFLLIYKMFVVDEMIEEAQQQLSNTSDPISVKECNDYLEFVKNLKSMKILLEDPALCMDYLKDHEPLMNEIIYYLEERNRSMQELTDTLKSFNNTLENLANTLSTLVDSSSKK
jgi:hypothetical protein